MVPSPLSKMNFARFDFDNAIASAQNKLGAVAHDLENKLNVRDISIVGGAPRDLFLGAGTFRPVDVKDFDIILPQPPVGIEKNPNVLWCKKNSFGGIKMAVRDIGVVDVFNQYTDDAPMLVAYFDYNCNSLLYSAKTKRLETSAYFLHFVETSTLQIAPWYVGQPENTAIRAIKLQIKFADMFGLNIRLGDDIIKFISNMRPADDAPAHAYARAKIDDANLRHRVVCRYNELRRGM